MFTGEDLLHRIMFLIPMILSLTVHEWAHAYSAFRLGDDTAARQGRLTLNPIPHIDPIGTLLLPLLNVPFGWAKPVPVVPTRFRRDVSMRTGMMITAAAGPISNLVLAILATVVWGLLLRVTIPSAGVKVLLSSAIMVNLALFIFNFIPVPPLDGSRIVDGLVPYRLRGEWEQAQRYAPIVLLVVIFFGSSLIRTPMNWLADQLGRLMWFVAGRG